MRTASENSNEQPKRAESQWNVRRLKYLARLQFSNVNKKTEEGEDDVRLCNYVDVYYNDFITSTLDFMKATATKEEISKFTLNIGDVLLTKDSETADDIGIPAYVAEQISDLVCGYHLAILRPADNIYGKYLFRFLSSRIAAAYFEQRANGITRFAIGLDTVGGCPIHFPPLPIQKAIAVFLDKETARIDALIAKKERQIKLLQEKRQAIITRAITKGLDPNAKMKDSGIEWIGEIPEGWEVKKLRYIGTCQNGISKGGEYFGSGNPFVSYGDVYRNYELPNTVEGLVESSEHERNACSVKEGDIIFTRTSETIEEIGLASTCMSTIKDAVFAGFLIRFRPKPNVLHKVFSKYYFRADIHRKYFIKEMNIVTRASLSQDLLKNLPVLLPSQDEMERIGAYLDDENKKIDILQQKIKMTIVILCEYRSSLITAAVSGQTEIPSNQTIRSGA